MKPLSTILIESILNPDLDAPTKYAEKFLKIRELFQGFYKPYNDSYPYEEDRSIGWNDEPICNLELDYPDKDIDKLFNEFAQKLKKVTTIKTKTEKATAYSPQAYYTVEFPKLLDSKNEPLRIWVTDSREADDEYFVVEAPKSLFDK